MSQSFRHSEHDSPQAGLPCAGEEPLYCQGELERAGPPHPPVPCTRRRERGGRAGGREEGEREGGRRESGREGGGREEGEREGGRRERRRESGRREREERMITCLKL